MIEARKTKLGADHPDTLRHMGYLACIYRKQGRWEEAEKLFEQTIKSLKPKVGADHPVMRWMTAELAKTRRDQARDTNASALMEDGIQARQRVF